MEKRFDPGSSPEFCFIAPTQYLDYVKASNTHLILAHIVDHDDKYASFYKELSGGGYDKIIMDNGAFELGESYAPDKLLSLAKKSGAHAIVLPDYPAKPFDVTIEAAKKYLPIFKDAGFETMFVPQSEISDKEGWIRSYEWAAGNLDIDIIGMSILAIPNALPHIPRAYARVVMTEILHDRKILTTDKYHHYLGLNAGPGLEIPPLIEFGVLNSCDSSNPIWMAILGHQYSENTDSLLPVKKVKKEVDFSFPWIRDDDTHSRIEHNIKLTQALFE